MTDVYTAAEELEGRSAPEILRWASERIPRLAFATGFGLEGCVIVDIIARERLPIEVFTLDTGVLFPETYALWHRLEEYYGIAIRGVQPLQTIGRQAAAHGPELWTREPDRCCELRKIAPLQRTLTNFDGWITGIRRDQTPERATARLVEPDARFGLIKVNPLAAWSLDDVWAHLLLHDVPYNELHDRGYPSIGCAPCTSPVAAGEDARAGRWRGSAKRECGLHLPTDLPKDPHAA